MPVTLDDLRFVAFVVVAYRILTYARLATDAIYRTETYIRRRDREHRPLEDQKFVGWSASWDFWWSVGGWLLLYGIARYAGLS